MSGKIVDVRDQVLSIFLVFSAFMASIRAIRRSSTHGPFLLERLICPHFLPRTRRAGTAAEGGGGTRTQRPKCADCRSTRSTIGQHTRERGRRSGAAIRV